MSKQHLVADICKRLGTVEHGRETFIAGEAERTGKDRPPDVRLDEQDVQAGRGRGCGEVKGHRALSVLDRGGGDEDRIDLATGFEVAHVRTKHPERLRLEGWKVTSHAGPSAQSVALWQSRKDRQAERVLELLRIPETPIQLLPHQRKRQPQQQPGESPYRGVPHQLWR